MVSFCILMIYNHLLTCDKNFQLEAHDKKIDLSTADFERVRLLQEPKFLVRFCIFLTCNKCEREAYGMQTGFFSCYFFGLCRLKPCYPYCLFEGLIIVKVSRLFCEMKSERLSPYLKIVCLTWSIHFLFAVHR